ncbi:MAG: hypothetical protein IJT20_03845 [Synergistaceae bacterium]|nr:hypothetical protein [Synergistaceae bacterium]
MAWEKLFDKYNILQKIENDGVFNISAEQIKEFREPRLMAKFDHNIDLPEIFLKNKLAILPTTRGEYVISHFDAYHKFEDDSSPIIKVPLPSYIQSLDSNNITSEAIALHCAVASGIIADFTEDSDIFATVSGRMGSGIFSFNINDVNLRSSHQVNVVNSQIEIDAGYEGVSCLALFEAKLDISDDFLIRQLYYPFRTWLNRVTKPIKTIFFIYSNGIFRLFEYAFNDVNNYNSLQLIKQKNYSIEDTTILLDDIQAVLRNVIIVEEPKIPFPQADNFERVINICELLSFQELNKANVTEIYDFVSRQANYYTDAARYLGLLEKRNEDGKTMYLLTEKGHRILKLNYKQRQLAFCNIILSHRAFNASLRLYFQKGVMPSINEVVDIMTQSELFNIESHETYKRRAGTIKGWLNWIISLINE